MHRTIPSRSSWQTQWQRGFTVIELLAVIVIIGILLALIISARAGVTQKEHDTERQRDIGELRDVLEAYYSQNDKYPTLATLNDSKWRAGNARSLDKEVWRDPSSTSYNLATRPSKNVYAYKVTSADGTTCDDAKIACTQYTLTATLETGSAYSKNNLN